MHREMAGSCKESAACAGGWGPRRRRGGPDAEDETGSRSRGARARRTAPGETWPRAGRHLPGRRARPRTTSTAGCSRRRSCTPTATALDIAVKDGRIVGVRGRAVDRVNHGRLGPKDLFGWQANDSPDRLTRPLVRRGRRARRDRLGHRDGRASSAGRRSCSTSRGPSAIGFYTTGQLFLEEYYTLGADRARRHRHQPRRRQHPAVHGHRRRGAQGVVRLRRPARLLHRRRPRRRHRALRAQRGRDPDRAVDAHPRPAGRAEPAAARRASTRG